LSQETITGREVRDLSVIKIGDRVLHTRGFKGVVKSVDTYNVYIETDKGSPLGGGPNGQYVATKSLVTVIKNDKALLETNDTNRCKDIFNKVLHNATKEGEKMNKNIVAAFPKTEDAVLVEEQLGGQIGAGFIAGLTILDHTGEILTEAKRLKAEKEAK
jgi:hypothetical protein